MPTLTLTLFRHLYLIARVSVRESAITPGPRDGFPSQAPVSPDWTPGAEQACKVASLAVCGFPVLQ